MAQAFYTGQNNAVTVAHTYTDGSPILHADIQQVRYVLRHDTAGVLAKFALTAPAGWSPVVADVPDGEFTFVVTEAMGKKWPAGRVFMEWHITLNSGVIPEGFRPMGEEHLFNVFVTGYSKQ